MRILMSRARVGAQEPTYSYRLHVPFGELSLERQALISMWSDFGLGAGLLARLPDVIAPMRHLEAPPGVEKHRFGKLVDETADRVGAVLLGATFPEMVEPSVPFRMLVASAPPNTAAWADIINLAGRYEILTAQLSVMTAAGLGLKLEGDR